MEEQWRVIQDFPNYSVSDFGGVVNNKSGRFLIQSEITGGAYKVGLFKDGRQYNRSVKVLVAEAFVDGRDELHNTPIQLDGHPENMFAGNLMWRPRWFAWKYTRQFSEVSRVNIMGPVLDSDTHEVFQDVYTVGVTFGLLFKDVWRSMNTDRRIFPTNQKFELVR